MTLYEIDCDIELLENELDDMELVSEDDFLSYTDKMLTLLNLKDTRNNKIN